MYLKVTSSFVLSAVEHYLIMRIVARRAAIIPPIFDVFLVGCRCADSKS